MHEGKKKKWTWHYLTEQNARQTWRVASQHTSETHLSECMALVGPCFMFHPCTSIPVEKFECTYMYLHTILLLERNTVTISGISVSAFA